MRLRVLHETDYRYERPARHLVQLLRMSPRGHEGQHVRHWRIEPSVDGLLSRREDVFGNEVHFFSADAPTEALTVRVAGEVESHDAHGMVRGCVERLPDLAYLRETELTRPDEAIVAFANDAATGATDTLDRLHRLLVGLNATMRFQIGPTDASTTAAQAFGLGHGVCQDLSHVFLAAARTLSIPARYVSGYFHRNDGVVDQDAGHAWAEAKVPGLGWVGFDPANGIGVTPAHLRVAIGLDYLGAAPIRGSRRGGGLETLEVRVRVEEGDDPRRTAVAQEQRQAQS